MTFRVAVVGATGFVGSRLLDTLSQNSHRVRALVRNPAKIPADVPVEIARVDLDSGFGFDLALEGVNVAVWLVHRMREGSAFADADRRSAELFAEACAQAGVDRIVYLGGLGSDSEKQSEHLASRSEVADALASTSVPVTTLRASIVLGAGSASFEIMRQLVEHLPVMVTPVWVQNRTQPIAIADLLWYLRCVVETPETAGQTYDVGGPEVLTFADMLQKFADVRDIPLWIFPVPVLSPALSARWIGLVTDVDPQLAKPLISSLTSETVVEDDTIEQMFPRELSSFETSVADAIDDALRLGLQTHMGQDLVYLQDLAFGVGLNWLGLKLTEPGRLRREDAALGVMCALGLLALRRVRDTDVDLGPLDLESVVAGLGSGAAAAAVTALASRVLVRASPTFAQAVRGVLRRDQGDHGGLPASSLALAGFSEELWWRGALRSRGDELGSRDLASFAAWTLPIIESGEPTLALAALTMGPIWTLIAHRWGPISAGLSHAVWLVGTRNAARRLVGKL